MDLPGEKLAMKAIELEQKSNGSVSQTFFRMLDAVFGVEWVERSQHISHLRAKRQSQSERELEASNKVFALRKELALCVDISCEADHLERTKPITLCTQADH